MGKQAKWAVGIGAVVVLALALFFLGKAPPPGVAPPEAPLATANPPPPPKPAAEPAPRAATQPPAERFAPTLDVVRIDPTGNATVAGKAEAEARVSLRLDGQEIAAAPADGGGDFASLFTIPPADVPRVLTVVARGTDGVDVQGLGRVIVAPIAAPQIAQAGSNDAAPEPLPEPAPQILKQTNDAVAIVTAQPLDNITIDTVTYEGNDIRIGGRGDAGAAVRLYLDDADMASAAIGADGTYSALLQGAAPGTYRLRADQLDASGRVTSRYEMEIVKLALDSLAQLAPQTVVIEVSKGASLWAIAKEHLGDGLLYVQVYAANSDKIRDPDLIYPGQVFAVPVLKMAPLP